jgi:hypothetical protein
MAEMIAPMLDFSLIDARYQGFWVVVRVRGDRQEILGEGESALEAVRMSKVDPDDPSVILTQVPRVPTAARMASPGRK